jgi:hypothetical protein
MFWLAKFYNLTFNGVQIKIWTCYVQHTNNIHKDNLRKMVFWGEMCGFFYSEKSNHHQRCEFKHRSDEVYSIQHYVIKFVSDLRQVGGFLRLLRFLLQKNDRHDITEILLKVTFVCGS